MADIAVSVGSPLDRLLRLDRGSARSARREAAQAVRSRARRASEAGAVAQAAADDAARGSRIDAFRERTRRLLALTKGTRQTDSVALLRAGRER